MGCLNLKFQEKVGITEFGVCSAALYFTYSLKNRGVNIMRFAGKRGGEADSKVTSLSSFKSLSSKQAGTRNVWPLILLLAIAMIAFYGIYSAASQVSLGAQPNASWTTNGSISLFCRVLGTGDPNIGPNNLTNVSLWTNVTGAWLINQTVNDSTLTSGATAGNTSIFNNTQVQFNLTGLGTARGQPFGWNCSVSANFSIGADGSTNAQRYISSNNSYQFFGVDKTAPQIRLNNPRSGGYLNSTTAYWEVELVEHNKNSTGVSFYYRRQGSPSFQAFKAMSCMQSANSTYDNSYNCSVTVDISAEIGAGEADVIEFYFNATDFVNLTGSNGTANSPNSVTVDTVKPFLNVFNITGAGVNWNTRTATTGLFNVTFNVSDASPQNCTLLHNISSAGYVSNFTVGYASNASANFTIPNVNGIAFITNGSGIYNFSITCNDSAANRMITGRNLTIAVDTQAPNVSISLPSNNINLRTRTLFVNFTAIDNMINSLPRSAVGDTVVSVGNDSCELWTNMTGSWAINTTITNYTGFVNNINTTGGLHNFTLTVTADGKYLYGVQCNDTAGNRNATTNFTINIDTVNPTINAINETLVNWNTRNVNGTSFLFTVNVSDQSNDSCFVFHNISSAGMVQNVSVNVANGINATFPNVDFAINGSGVVNVTIGCNDTAGNLVNSSSFAFVADTQAPNVTLISNATTTGFVATSTFGFQFTPVDNMNKTLPASSITNTVVSGGNESCELWTNMTGAWAINKTTTNYTGFANNFGLHNFTGVTLANGIYLWNVQCNDSAGNKAAGSANNTLKVDTVAPVLILPLPNNGSRFISSSATQFHVNVTELNVNATSTGNITVWFRRMGTSVWRNSNLTCTGTAPAYNCSVTTDTATFVLNSETMEYYFEMTDKAQNTGNNGTSANPLIAVADSIPPTMNSTNASGINWNTRTARTKTISFSVIATESNPANCTAFTNMTGAWAGNESSTAPYTNGGNSSLTGFSFSDEGVFNYTIRCNDTAGNLNFTTTNYTFGVDITPPNVTLSLPAASGTSRTKNVSVAFTPNDAFNNTGSPIGNKLGNSSCELWTNITGVWAINSTTTNYSSAFLNNYGSHNISILFTEDGYYLWNVQCNDTAGNYGVGSGNRTLTIDTAVPTINTVNASAIEWNTRTAKVRSITFHINATDANPSSCAVWENSTGSMVQNLTAAYTSNANTSIGPINFSGDTVVNFTVNCSDSSGNHRFFPTNLTFVIDLAAPNVTLNAPANSAKLNTGSIGFQYTPVDNMNNSGVLGNSGGNNTCELWTNMTGSWVRNTTSANYTTSFANGIGLHNFTVTLADGDYLWNVQCNDSSSNYGVGSSNRTLTVDANSPVIQSFNVSSVNWNTKTSTGRSFTFYFNVTDNHSNTCTLYHNATGSLASNMTVSYTSAANTTLGPVNFSNDGVYNFSLECTDTVGRSSVTTGGSNFTLTIDGSAPAVALVAPASGSRRGATITFNFTPSDNLSLNTCQLFTNSSGSNAFVANYTNLSALNANNNATLTFGVGGDYAWNVRCNDTAGNAAFNSSNYTINVDADAPILSNWTYNESSQLLILGFNEQIDMVTGATLGSVSLNYTDGSIADGVSNLGSGANSSSTTNSTTVVIKLTSGQDSAVRKIQRNDPTSRANITLYGGAVKDLAGNNVVANTSRFTSYVKAWHVSPSWPDAISSTVRIPQTSTLQSWGWTSANTNTYNISTILTIAGLGSKYNVVYYNVDGTSSGWKVFMRNDWAGSSLQYINNTNDKDYEINMSGNSTRFELCCRTLT